MILNYTKKLLFNLPKQRIFRRYLSSGDKFTLDRIFTEEDLRSFAQLTGDWNSVHFHKDPSQSLVHGALLNGLVSGAMGCHLPGQGTILIEQTIKFPNPCYVGENVRLVVEVISVRKIILCKFLCSVGDKIVLDGEAKVMKTYDREGICS